MEENRNSNLAFYVAFGCWAALFAACRFWRLLPPGLHTALTVCFALVMAMAECVTLQKRLDRMLQRTHPELARRAADFFLRRNVEADLRRRIWALPEAEDLKEDCWFLSALVALTFFSALLIHL